MKKTYQISLESKEGVKPRDIMDALRAAADKLGVKVTVKQLPAAPKPAAK